MLHGMTVYTMYCM